MKIAMPAVWLEGKKGMSVPAGDRWNAGDMAGEEVLHDAAF